MHFVTYVSMLHVPIQHVTLVLWCVASRLWRQRYHLDNEFDVRATPRGVQCVTSRPRASSASQLRTASQTHCRHAASVEHRGGQQPDTQPDTRPDTRPDTQPHTRPDWRRTRGSTRRHCHHVITAVHRWAATSRHRGPDTHSQWGSSTETRGMWVVR